MKYNIATNDQGHVVAITRDDKWILHLKPGLDLNEQNVVEIVAWLNDAERLKARIAELERGLRHIAKWNQQDQDDHISCMIQWRGCVSIARRLLNQPPAP